VRAAAHATATRNQHAGLAMPVRVCVCIVRCDVVVYVEHATSWCQRQTTVVVGIGCTKLLLLLLFVVFDLSHIRIGCFSFIDVGSCMVTHAKHKHTIVKCNNIRRDGAKALTNVIASGLPAVHR
jgi:hypothetical protein